MTAQLRPGLLTDTQSGSYTETIYKIVPTAKPDPIDALINLPTEQWFRLNHISPSPHPLPLYGSEGRKTIDTLIETQKERFWNSAPTTASSAHVFLF